MKLGYATLAAILAYTGCASDRGNPERVDQTRITTDHVADADVRDIHREDFEEVVLHSGRPAVVDFYTDWCSVCQGLEEPYRRASQTLGSRMAFMKYDVQRDLDDDQTAILDRYGIRSVPTIIVFHDGNIACRVRWRGDDDRLVNDLESCVDSIQSR